MRQTVEREVKLVPDESFTLADFGEPSAPRVFTSTYYDTPDFRLARRGITLRNRFEDGGRLWQLKIPSGASRIELEVPGPPARPPAEMTELLVVHLRDGEPLVKVARLRTQRQVVVRDGAEIVEDSVSVYEARRIVRRFREVEVELVGGDERTLRKLERELGRAGALPDVFTPKVFRALDLPFESASPVLASDAPPAVALGHALLEQQRSLLDHDPGTRLGVDAEDLHQMRVATRRARAFLRAAHVLVDPVWADPLRSELGWLGSALGPARDADVLLEHMRREVDALGTRSKQARGLVRALEKERDQAREVARAAMTEARYFALLDALEGAENPVLAEGSTATLSDLWWKEFRRTRRAFASLDRNSPDAALHDARIHVKRSRYAAELASHELGKPGRRFVDAAKRLQDVLGEHQDSTVAKNRILVWAEQHPGAEAAADDLLERELRRRRKTRRDWPDAWDAFRRRARAARP